MWKAEEDYPRGGSKIRTTFQKSSSEKNEIENGRQTKTTSRDKPIKAEKAVKLKPRKRKFSDSISPEKIRISKRPKKDTRPQLVDAPLRQDLTADICVLACVRQVHSYSASLSLPGNLVATLPITDISAAFTQLLQAVAQSQDQETEEVTPADELFKQGMLLPVMIKEIIDDKQRNKNVIRLSIVPSFVNANIPLSAVEDGMLLFGSVSSVEDHGYRVDLGIKGMEAFLTMSDAEKFIHLHHNGSPLTVGYPLWCVLKMKSSADIKSRESRVVNVTIDPDIVQQAKMPQTSNLNSLAPGMVVTGTIQSITDSGLHVTVFSFQGMVHSSQLPKSTNQYESGEEIQLRILYINPQSKIIQLSALSQIVQFNGSPLHLFADLSIGKNIEGSVIYMAKKKGVYFKLPENVKGFATVKQLSDEEDLDITKYEKGMRCSCRILGFNFMEGVALVTLKPSVLQQKFLSVQEISVGDIVEAFVKDVTSNGVVVKLSKSIYSFVSCLHLADVPIKHPEKKFQSDMKMKCRVLKVDYQKSKVMLTHKQSLVKSRYPIITDYSQLRPGMELEGYIIAVKETVVVVAFFNDVKGIVTLKDMSTEKVDDPSTMFYIGQIVRCRVVHYNIDEKKLKLSFNFGLKKVAKTEKLDYGVSNYKVGKAVEAKVLKVEKDGYRVLLQPRNGVAFLPFCHLSDFHEVQELRKLAIKPGHQFEKVIYFNQKHKIIVTMKESFIHAAEENLLVEHFEDLKTGMLLPAVIKNHQEYGMFLELAAGHTGLCPAKTLTHLQPSNLQELFQPGQTIITRLSKIDTEKKRFLGSARFDECSEGGIDTSLNLLKTYLSARDKMLDLIFAENDSLSMYEGLSIGDIVDVTVSSALKKGILGDLPSGAKALATKVNLAGIEPRVGIKYKAVVLLVDLLTPCVELSLDQKLVKAVMSRKENSKTMLKSGQILKADVLLVKPEFMLMSLRGHGTGKFVYIPVKQHLNDVEVDKPYEPGTFTEVVLKSSCDGYQLAILKSQDPETIEKERMEKINLKNMPKHNIKPGMTVDAKVRAIHPLQLNLLVNNLHGRVHITEVTDRIEEGEYPLHRFSQDQTLSVKVIGLRDVKSHSYLPITNPKSNRTILECTLKESKLDNTIVKDLLKPKLDIKNGDQILAYVLKISSYKVWFQVSLTQQGYVDIFHLSTDMSVLNDAISHFKTGQAYQVTVLESDNDDKLVLSRIGGKMKVTAGEPVTAQITSIKPGVGLYVKLPAGQLGIVKTKPLVLHYVGQFIRCQVTEAENSVRCILTLFDQSQGPVMRIRKRRRDETLLEPESKEKKIIKMKKLLKLERKKKESEEQGDSGVDVAKDSSASDSEEGQMITQVKKDGKIPRLSMQGFSWEGELSARLDDAKAGSDDDGDDIVKVDASKLKKKRKRDEEKIIQEYERTQLEGNTNPQSANDFERLLLQSPNSSVIWLRYMAFHIEQGEVEKARAVAEKALSTITFREEQEKKNIWLAYLNMETIYGEASEVKKLLERAVTYNDALDINLKMCDIYVAAGKMEDAELLYAIMTRKYKRDKAVWKLYGQFLFKAGKEQVARNLLQRCISVLDKKDHVEVIAKFANLEFTDGDKERGRTMFENLIASYPSRTDLWSVYVDMVAKVGDIEGARQIMERAVKQKLATKKLSFLIQKYIRFEETHGSEDQVQRVKDMALTLFES